MLLLLALVIVLPGIGRSLAIDNQLLGPSEWRECETATIARHFLEEPNIFYPRINWGAPGPGYVEAEFQLMPFAVHLLYRVFGHQPWLGRALAVVLAAFATLLMFQLARRCMGPWAALMAAFAFASAPLTFRYGSSFMPEAMVLVCYLFAADRFTRWLTDRRWSSILTAGAVLGLGIGVKPTSVHVGLVAGLVALQRGGPRLLFGRQMLAFGAVALLPAALYFAHAADLHQEYGNTFGVISGGDSKWGSWARWLDPDFYLTVLRIDVVYGMGYAGTLLVLLALFVGRSPALRFACWAWLLVLLLYYMIVARYAGHESRGMQYHIYAVVPLALAVGAGTEALWRLVSRRLPARPVVALAVVGLVGLVMALQQWRSNRWFLAASKNDLFARAGQALASVCAADELVLVTSTDVAWDGAVENNFEEPKVMFHAWRQGCILARDKLQLENLQQAAHSIDARFLVVLDQVLVDAAEDFLAAIGRYPVVVRGEGFEVLRLPD